MRNVHRSAEKPPDQDDGIDLIHRGDIGAKRANGRRGLWFPAVAYLIALCAFIQLVSYAMGLEAVYRPLQDGPATHPMTAIFVGILALALGRGPKNSMHFGCLIVLAISAVIVIIPQSALHMLLIPEKVGLHQDPLEISGQRPGAVTLMGINTAKMLGCLAASIIAWQWKRSAVLAVILATFSLVPPSLAVYGYGVGSKELYGHMALSTAMLSMPLIVLALAEPVMGLLARRRAIPEA